MKYEEFKETMSRKLSEIISPIDGMEIKEVTLKKVNCNADAISIIKGKGSVKNGPTLRFDEMYDYYVNVADGNFSETLEFFLARAVMAFQFVEDIDSKGVIENGNWNDMELTMQVINVERNEDLLKDVPHRILDGLDLAIIYRMIVDRSEDDGFNSVIITHDIAEDFGKSEKELYGKAKYTMEDIFPCSIGSHEGTFCIVTNSVKSLGAIYAFDENILSDIAEMMDADLYILPSSLHECFIIPNVGQDVEEMKNIIKIANETVVTKEEFLSDNPYLYVRKENTIVMA